MKPVIFVEYEAEKARPRPESARRRAKCDGLILKAPWALALVFM